MKKVKQEILNIVKEFAETKQPFSVEDVLFQIESECNSTYVTNRLYDLSIGAFPILRRITDSQNSLLSAKYISVKIKQPDKKKVNPGMDKETFHAIYGCFGVAEVVKGGRYIYNKPEVNKIRLKVSSYLNTHLYDRENLVRWLRKLVKQNASIFRRQSIQIGTIQALQNSLINSKDIFGVLYDSKLCNSHKGHKFENIQIRSNAHNRRQNTTK